MCIVDPKRPDPSDAMCQVDPNAQIHCARRLESAPSRPEPSDTMCRVVSKLLDPACTTCRVVPKRLDPPCTTCRSAFEPQIHSARCIRQGSTNVIPIAPSCGGRSEPPDSHVTPRRPAIGRLRRDGIVPAFRTPPSTSSAWSGVTHPFQCPPRRELHPRARSPLRASCAVCAASGSSFPRSPSRSLARCR